MIIILYQRTGYDNPSVFCSDQLLFVFFIIIIISEFWMQDIESSVFTSASNNLSLIFIQNI